LYTLHSKTISATVLLRHFAWALLAAGLFLSHQSASAQVTTTESTPNSNLDYSDSNIAVSDQDSLNQQEVQSSASSDQLPSSVRNQLGLADTPASPPHNSSPDSEPVSDQPSLTSFLSSPTDQLTSPEGLTSSIKVALILATLSLAPAIVLMTTCYVRVIVVLTLLKQAFGAQQLPPTQVLTALSLFVTLLIMTPVWTEVKQEAIDPYTQT